MNNENCSYRRYLDGDTEALCELVDEYKTGLTLYINSIVADITLAEDIMLDTFAKLIIKKPKYLGKSSFKTWLFAIGRNIAMDTLKKSRADVPLSEAENYISEADGLEESYLADEKKLEVRQAVKSLKGEHSQALWLVYSAGYEKTVEQKTVPVSEAVERAMNTYSGRDLENTGEVLVRIEYSHSGNPAWNTPDCVMPFYKICFKLKDPEGGYSYSEIVAIAAVEDMKGYYADSYY